MKDECEMKPSSRITKDGCLEIKMGENRGNLLKYVHAILNEAFNNYAFNI